MTDAVWRGRRAFLRDAGIGALGLAASRGPALEALGFAQASQAPGFQLVDVTGPIIEDAAILAASVRSLDAIHLASARHVRPDEILVYDRKLARAAAELGFVVVQPGV